MQADWAKSGTFVVDDVGNYYVAVDTDTATNARIARFGADGSPVWTFDLEGANSVAVAADQTVYAGGDGLLVRLNEDGIVDWDVALSREIKDLAVDPEGDVIVASSSDDDILLLDKYGSDGAIIWDVSVPGTSNHRGLGLEPSITVDSNGDVYVTGSFYETVVFGSGAIASELTSAGNSDFFVARYDSDGTFQSAFGLGSTAEDGAQDIIASDEHFYITGYFENDLDVDPGPGSTVLESPGCYDAFVAKYQLDGTLVWADDIGGPASCTEANGYAVAVDEANNVYVSGYFFDFGGERVDFDPGPGVKNVDYDGEEDAFIASFDADGAYRWAYGITSNHAAYGLALATSGSDRVSVMINTRLPATFNPNPDAIVDPEGGGIAVARYASNGYVLAKGDDNELPDRAIYLSAYPNPAAQRLVANVSITSPERVRIAIFDLLGRKRAAVYEGTLATDRDFHVDLSSLPSGSYLLRVTGEHTNEIRPFIHVR